MKIDLNKKHPFTSVTLIPEGEEDEYLTEEQTAEFRKAALSCVHTFHPVAFFSVLTLLCNLIDINDLFRASGTEALFGIMGYVSLGCLILSLIRMYIVYRRLEALSRRFEAENRDRG